MGECVEYIKKDLYRYTGDISIRSFLKQYFHIGEGFRFTVWLRVCHFTYNKKLERYTIFPVARCLYRKYRYKYGYDIGYKTEIGPGLLLYHFGGVVFVPQRCGKNVTISQGTTVGMRYYDGEQKYPVIGDNVYMAPGACVVGDVKVGNDTAIGTSSLLMNSVEDNSVVVGIPGKVVSFKGSKEYVDNLV